MHNEISKYDHARTALAEAKTIIEVSNIRDQAEAMRQYARRAKDDEFQRWAAEIKLRAERKAGQMLKESVSPGRPIKEMPQAATFNLDSMGITRSDSSRWQKEASLDEEVFEQFIHDGRSADRLTTSALLRLHSDLENKRITAEAEALAKKQREKKAEELAAKAKELKAQKVQENITAGDTPAVAEKKAIVIVEAMIEEETVPELPKYDCIVIDPPWPMEKISLAVSPGDVGFDYPTMSIPEIERFPLDELAGDDCHLFLWTTQKFLPDALSIAGVWGFHYILTMVWHKNGGFQPFGLPQYNCEFVIYARKGTPKFVDTKAFPCCFSGRRREHSRKPDEFYDLIARVTDGKRIDVFSREKRAGFDQSGFETDKFESA